MQLALSPSLTSISVLQDGVLDPDSVYIRHRAPVARRASAGGEARDRFGLLFSLDCRWSPHRSRNLFFQVKDDFLSREVATGIHSEDFSIQMEKNPN